MDEICGHDRGGVVIGMMICAICGFFMGAVSFWLLMPLFK